jgi:hypothetical protein
MKNDGVKFRRNDFDVDNTVNVTDPASVSAAVESIFLDLYPRARADILNNAVQHIATLYRGEHPDYLACDTSYHDLQHTLDVTLASARLMDGYERSHHDGIALGEQLFTFGILLALFHDSGYLRKRGHEENRHGAEFTMVHVSRGAELVKRYMQKLGMDKMADIAARAIHFTGYEISTDAIQLPSPVYRAVGNMVATADILAQMSDRCYLEKCHDRLYGEFVLAGIASKLDEQGNKQVVFASPQDLVVKTPGFYRGAKKRLDETLEGAHQYAGKHFGGQNLYLDAVEKNIQFAEYMIAHNADIGMLQRTPPQTPGSDQLSPQEDDRKQLVEDRRKRIGDRRKNTDQRYPDLRDRRTNKDDRRKKPSAP